jgi:hypothetical protein
MKLLRTTALTAALMTAAVMSLTSPAQAQLAWWGWPGLVAAGTGTGNPYATAYGYAPTYNYVTGWSYPGYGYGNGTGYNYSGYAYGYGTGYGYPASRYATSQYQPYNSYGGYGMWNNPWYSAAYHPFIRRHIPLWARAAGVRRHWQ